MKWFKFYGQDFLTDSKIGSLHPLQKLMWVGLLCIASQDENKTGLIENLSEDHLMRLCGIEIEDLERAGVKPYVTLVTFCNINIVTCNKDGSYLINNYHKKQTQQATSSERVKAWRDRNRAIKSNKGESSEGVTVVTNVTLQGNGRVDKNRIDNNTMNSSAKNSTLKNKKMKNYNETDFSDSGERVIDADSGEERNKKPKAEGKNKVAIRIQHKFAELCKKNIGTIPVQNVATYQISLFALNSGGLTEPQIYDLFEEWFSLPEKKDEQLISINQALSAHNINGYKVRNNVK